MRRSSVGSWAMRSFLVALLDFLAILLALLVGYWLWIKFPWHGNYQFFSDYAQALWILPLLALVVFKLVGLYKPEAGLVGVEEQSLIFKGIWIVYACGFAVSFFYRDVSFSRLAVFYSIFFAVFFVTVERYIIRCFFEWLNQQGIGVRNVLIYGAGYHGQRLERWIRQSPKLGIRVVGYLDDNTEKLVKKTEFSKILGGFENLAEVAEKYQARILFIAHRKLDEEDVLGIFHRCRELGIRCWIIPSLYQFHVERAELSNIGGIPLVGFRDGLSLRYYIVFKRVLDIILSLLLMLVALPVAGAIILLIRATSPGVPVFFRQVRVGLGGKHFMLYKFRTLKPGFKNQDVSPELVKNGGKAGPDAVLPMGAFLRRSGLDELPQLWNVLRGDMSLIGPRPEMPFIVEKYGPLERERLFVKPGITGLWQISEDRKRYLIHENMDYDLYYVEHLGFNLDLAILIKTASTVMRRIFEKSSKKS